MKTELEGSFLALLDPSSVLWMAAIIAGSALLRGFTGFGFGIAAVPLMGLVIGPAQAVAVAVGLQFFGGLPDSLRTRRWAHWPSLRWLMAGALIGSPLGTLALASVSQPLARLLISTICIIAVVFLAVGRAFSSTPRKGATSVVGLIAGIFNGLAAMPGPPVVAYYMAMPVTAASSRASLGTFFTASAGLALVSSALAGLWSLDTSMMVLIGLPVMLAGTFIGELLFRRVGSHHRKASLAVLAAIALLSGWQGIMGH